MLMFQYDNEQQVLSMRLEFHHHYHHDFIISDADWCVLQILDRELLLHFLMLRDETSTI